MEFSLYATDVEKLSGFLAKLKQESSLLPRKNHTENHSVIQNTFIPKEKQREYILKCLQQNEQCYSLLNLMESCLNSMLEDCIKEKRILNMQINMRINQEVENQLKNTNGRKGCIRKISRAPYFKDRNGFSHPPNEDVSKRKIQGFINRYDVIVPQPWNEYEKSIVANCIRNAEKEKWTQTLASCGMLHMKNIQQMSLAELVELRYDEYDWLKISVSALKNTHSPQECRALWFNSLHPQINQENWTQEEQEKLRILIEKHKFQDWERIARELGTKRGSFQCISQFKALLNKRNTCKWKENEVKLLQKCVKMFTYQNVVPWNKLKIYIDGRDLNDIFKVWRNLSNTGNSGTFSLEEDIILVAGMKYLGNDYSHIKEYIPNRSARQVRKRVEVLKRRQFPMKAWSEQEDTLLKTLVKKYGFGNWVNMSMHFVNRSPSAIRSRYTSLRKYESHKSCASLTPKNPVRSTDPANIALLWESAVDICQRNKIEYKINNSETSSTVVHELSRVLKPETQCSRKATNQKFKSATDKQFIKFFQGAYLPKQNLCTKRYHHRLQKRKIRSSAYDTLMILKLLDAKINLPVIEKIDEDETIPEHDKSLAKYLQNKLTPNNLKFAEIFSSSDEKYSMSDECLSMLPPNFSTLIAMRSLLLNEENLQEQAHGLTVEVDNINLKEMNSLSSTKSLHNDESHVTASKLWNERLHKLLGGVIHVTKE